MNKPRRGDTAVVQALTDDPDSKQIRTRAATLLFSDIVGITPYFDRFGDQAGHARIRCHNDLLFPQVQAHRGRVVKTIGDAIMAVFDQPQDGVAAAVGMQRALAAHNDQQTDPDEHIFIRIGLHAGQAIVDQADIFGDAVNVAARVSSEAVGEQILISADLLAGLPPDVVDTRFHTRTWLKGKDTITEIHEVVWRSTTGPGPAKPQTAPGPAAGQRQAPGSPKPIHWVVGLLGLALLLLVVAIWSGTGAGESQPKPASQEPEPFVVPAPITPPPPVPEAARSQAPRQTPDPVPAPPTRSAAVKPDPKARIPAPQEPAPPPVLPATADQQSGASRSPALAVFQKRDQLTKRMEQLGIIPGDLPEVDMLLTRAASLSADQDHAGALKSIGQAHRGLDRFRLTRVFLLQKMSRISSQLPCHEDQSGGDRCQGLAAQVNSLLSRKMFRSANMLLNSMLVELGPSKKAR